MISTGRFTVKFSLVVNRILLHVDTQSLGFPWLLIFSWCFVRSVILLTPCLRFLASHRCYVRECQGLPASVARLSRRVSWWGIARARWSASVNVSLLRRLSIVQHPLLRHYLSIIKCFFECSRVLWRAWFITLWKVAWKVDLPIAVGCFDSFHCFIPSLSMVKCWNPLIKMRLLCAFRWLFHTCYLVVPLSVLSR